MPKGVPNKRYTGEFKQMVADWERIYLMEGPEGLYIERRGRGSKGRPTMFPKAVEEDLLKEVQWLRAENAYLKNCNPWLWKKSDARAKSKGDPETKART